MQTVHEILRIARRESMGRSYRGPCVSSGDSKVYTPEEVAAMERAATVNGRKGGVHVAQVRDPETGLIYFRQVFD